MSDNKVVYGDAGRIKERCIGLKKEENNGDLARLEKGNAYSIILPLIHNDQNRQRAEDVGLLVGHCYGISRRHIECGNFGSSLRNLSIKVDGNGIKLRANKIMMSDNLEDISKTLPHIVRWMKQKSIGIDFWKLYVDLYFWGDSVKRHWSSEFYGWRE